jgi:hypothetical protein
MFILIKIVIQYSILPNVTVELIGKLKSASKWGPLNILFFFFHIAYNSYSSSFLSFNSSLKLIQEDNVAAIVGDFFDDQTVC